ncbi:MAG TPA: cupin domain-containing protein [Thermoanaerobaculia bacterium]|nr:cupin domain-containing protein [Thermoanaerobaculia bacterium]
MRIHADLRLPAMVRTDELPWVESPMPGVHRRLLERDGDEVARATSLVRYAPGSRFSEHVHGGGEELLVLDGTFSDQHDDFPAGSYLRNPVGSRHAPRSDDGCVLFVKLHWMHADDRQVVRASLDATGEEVGWEDTDRAGVSARTLHRFRDESTSLLRLTPGVEVEGWLAPGGLELLVIEGSCSIERYPLRRTGWARLPPGSAPSLASARGCVLLCKEGHLRSPPPLP